MTEERSLGVLKGDDKSIDAGNNDVDHLYYRSPS